MNRVKTPKFHAEDFAKPLVVLSLEKKEKGRKEEGRLNRAAKDSVTEAHPSHRTPCKKRRTNIPYDTHNVQFTHSMSSIL